MKARLILTALFVLTGLQTFAQADYYEIREDEEWYKLEYWKHIKEGSALDFTGMGLLDAPAGKYGWLKAVGGHFEFENLPGVEQRFYGVNLCEGANFPTHSQTDDLIKRLAMLGYNAIRIHHHDEPWKLDSNKEKLDYLLYRAKETGMYVTTDLYVSRKVKWRDIGVDQDGFVPMGLYKGLVGCDDKSFEDWCNFTRDFLCHVNEYTGIAYKDDPSICLISHVNENKISAAYRTEFFLKNAGFLSWWKEFCEETHMEGADPEHPSKIWSPQYNEFSKWYQRKAFRRCSEFVRSLGCKALFSNDSNTMNAEDMGSASGFDYIDSHFYLDHPKSTKGWGLPSYLLNENPVVNRTPELLFKEYAVESDIPHVITEWNCCGPSKYRSMTGIMVGAMSSYMAWDGLWRFNYSHRTDYFEDDPKNSFGGVTYFCLAIDPLSQAADRVVIPLYLRRDAEPGSVNGKHLSEVKDNLDMDKETGTLRVGTPRTCGVFTTGGQVTAGALDVFVYDVPAAVYVTSLNDAPISSSPRMLLAHMTEVQGSGTRFKDSDCKLALSFGRGSLILKGSAEVSVKLDHPELYTVYELDTTGIRGRRLKTRVSDGALHFTVNSVNEFGLGTIYYEIVSKKFK